mgnify:CR=1 FL=1
MEKKAEKARIEELSKENSKTPLQSASVHSDSKTDWRAQKEEQAKARKKANDIKKVEDEIEKTENIRIRVPIGKKEMIQKCAKLNNESINGMVNRLIDEELLKQGLKKGD